MEVVHHLAGEGALVAENEADAVVESAGAVVCFIDEEPDGFARNFSGTTGSRRYELACDAASPVRLEYGEGVEVEFVGSGFGVDAVGVEAEVEAYLPAGLLEENAAHVDEGGAVVAHDAAHGAPVVVEGDEGVEVAVLSVGACGERGEEGLHIGCRMIFAGKIAGYIVADGHNYCASYQGRMLWCGWFDYHNISIL